MATSSSVRDLLKERKFPFILSLFLLLFVVTFLLISNSQKPPLYIATDIAKPQPNVPKPVPTPPPPPPPQKAPPPPDAGEKGSGGEAEWDSIRWKVCDDGDPVAVDYIPCLDNWKAISALKSRRHMEHRERHCPDPTPRCLVPIPAGYRSPVAWPKSRDMVRLLSFRW